MNNSENDPKQKPENMQPAPEPPERTGIRMALALPEWFRSVRAQRRLTPEEEEKLAEWFGQQMAGYPLGLDQDTIPATKRDNQFFVGLVSLREFVKAINPAVSVFAQTRKETHDGINNSGCHVLAALLSQVHSEHQVYYLSATLAVFPTFKDEPTGEIGMGDWRWKYNVMLEDAWGILRAWWSERKLPKLIEGAITLPRDIETISGDIEIISFDAKHEKMVRLHPPVGWWS